MTDPQAVTPMPHPASRRPNRIRIVVADDLTLVRRLLMQQLSREPGFEVVGEAADGVEAVEISLEQRPDVLVLDMSMPALNGMEVAERIRTRLPETRILMITAHDHLVSMGRFSGAAECLTKGCTPQELTAAVRRVGTAGAADGGGQRSGKAGEIVDRLAGRAPLTPWERTVLERLLGEDLTNQQIAHALSTRGAKVVSEAAVKHALQRIARKLNVEPRTRAALVRHALEVAQG